MNKIMIITSKTSGVTTDCIIVTDTPCRHAKPARLRKSPCQHRHRHHSKNIEVMVKDGVADVTPSCIWVFGSCVGMIVTIGASAKAKQKPIPVSRASKFRFLWSCIRDLPSAIRTTVLAPFFTPAIWAGLHVTCRAFRDVTDALPRHCEMYVSYPPLSRK